MANDNLFNDLGPFTHWLFNDAANISDFTGVLISPKPDQVGNKLMFLSELREFPSAPCLAGKQTW